MRGVNALGLYIACCDAFISFDHPEYWSRAWCLAAVGVLALAPSWRAGGLALAALGAGHALLWVALVGSLRNMAGVLEAWWQPAEPAAAPPAPG